VGLEPNFHQFAVPPKLVSPFFSFAEVDRIGWATAICYGLVIPCFLGFLFAKQNVVMRKVKTAVMQTARNEGKVIVRLQGLESEQSFKDRVKAEMTWHLFKIAQVTAVHKYILSYICSNNFSIF
jgi:hypothetical protein